MSPRSRSRRWRSARGTCWSIWRSTVRRSSSSGRPAGVEPRGMAVTFSIVAFEPGNGELGVAVASKFPCVGAVVPWAKTGVGAVATQAWANTDFGPDGLRLMAGGMPSGPALDAVMEGDEGREERQAGFVDARGEAATFTGSGCVEWAGGVSGEHFAAQGNILAGEGVVDSMAGAFASAEGELCDRLLAALLAG